MDEQRAWKKSRRKKRLRLLAAALSLCLLITTYPDILATLFAFAAGTRDGDGIVYVTGFESLPEEVREQTIPLGTGIEELTLPHTLEAFVAIAGEDASEEKANAPDKEENPDDPDRKEEDGSAGADTEAGDGSGSETGTEGTAAVAGGETGTEESGDSTETGGGGTDAGTGDETGTEGTDAVTGGGTGAEESGGADTGTEESGDSTETDGAGTDAGTGDETGTEENGGTGGGGTEGETPEKPADGDNADPAQGDNQTEEPGSAENGGADTEQETLPDTGNTADETHTQETEPAQEQEQEEGQDSREEQSAPEESGTEESEGESALSVQAEPAALSQETHTVTLPEYQSGQSLTIETLETSPAGEADGSADSTDGDTKDSGPQLSSTDGSGTQSSTDSGPQLSNTASSQSSTDITDIPPQDGSSEKNEPTEQPEQIKQVTVEGVTWESSPEYDGNTEGVYLFTPVLPDGYALSEGVSLPEIAVAVAGNTETAMIQALLERIAVLPEQREYLAKEPDKEVAEAYGEWEEKLYEYVEEALAIWEEYAALTKEQQAQIPERELAKLTAWVEIAEDMAATDGGEIALLMRPFDEANSSDMVYYLEGSYDSYSWEVWTGEEWQKIEEYDAELVVGKEEWYTCRFRCIVKKDGFFYTARAEDDWQIENMGIMLMAANAAGSGQSDYMYYNNDSAYFFNVKGLDNGTLIQTTFLDQGYRTASTVNGGGKVNWGSAGEVAMGNSLYGSREISLVYNGRYAKIKYTVTNRGSSSQRFQVGSSADVMIGNNDNAPVVGSSSGLVMSGSPKNNYTFNLVAPTASTLWYGFYSKAYDSMFTNLADRGKAYTKDSGMAWSWSATVAPGQTWSRYVLLGVGELPPAPNVPTLTNQNPRLEPGTPTVFTGKADPGNTVSIEVGGEEFTGTADSNGNFSIKVTPPEGLSEGTTDVNYYAVSAEGGVSDVGTVTGTVVTKPSVVLTDAGTSVMEDSALNDTWYRSFISSYSGTVSYNASSVKTGTPGTYTVTYTAKKQGYTDATAELNVTVLPLPLELSSVTAARVSGKDSFALSASLKHPGGEAIAETGFVWGIMQNPTVFLNNGSKKTASVIKTKNGSLSVTADDIVDGVTYYARAYVKTSGGIYYSPQQSFSINGKSYGTFTIKNNNDNTFTVTRSGGTDGTQTVYFRTVNGSAIGGTHFTHQASTLTFVQGETSKKITISGENVTAEYSINGSSKPATAYSNADRTYQVEIYRVDGGGTLGNTTIATRKMTKNSSYQVDQSIYNERKITDSASWDEKDRGDYEDDKLGWDKDKAYSAAKETVYIKDILLRGTRQYWLNTAQKLKYRLSFYAKEIEDGYQVIQITPGDALDTKIASNMGSFVGERNTTYYVAQFEHGGSGKDTSYAFYTFPYTSSSASVSKISQDDNRIDDECVLFDIGQEQMSVGYSASGAKSDKWTTKEVTHHFWLLDEREPQLLGIAPMAGGTYREGEQVTLSLVFDEIVDNTNSQLTNVSLATSWGMFTYAGGADTNVLFFTGTVPSGASGTLTVSGINNAGNIKDMCSGSKTASGGSGSVTVNVDTKSPSVSITGSSITNKTAKATISATNADTLQYTWSQSSAMPVTGWVTGRNGQTVSTKQTSGTWYLHVLGTYNGTGKTAHTYASFNFSDSASGAMPELTLSADNSTWAQSRMITLTKQPSNGTVTVKTPSGATSAVTGASYTATANGSYVFTLTASGETVVQSITVSRIDRTAPKAVITGPASLTQNENVKLTVTPADAGGSGVKTVTGQWTKTTNGGSSKTENATLTKNSDGTYSATTPGSAGNNYTYKLTVTVTDNAGNTNSAVSGNYTVNLKAPKVTVTKTGSNQKGDTYTYTVTANGNTITDIQLPDGSVTTVLSGTFTLTSPGTYYVIVSDAIGHVVRSSAMTVAAGVDGDAPDVRLYQQDEDWTSDKVQLDVSIYEEGSIAAAVWKKEGTASGTTLHYSKQETSVYSGSFSVTQNGTYTATVTDTTGNAGTASITVSNIDKTAPKVTCNIDATAAGGGWYADASVPVQLSFADNAGAEEGGDPSGIKTVQYKLVSGETAAPAEPASGLTALDTASDAFRSGKFTYEITGNGRYYLYYKVTDNAGNVTKGFSDLIQKDSCKVTAVVTGPKFGQPESDGLTMNVRLTYGPGGGILYAGSDGKETKLAALDSYGGMDVANKTVTKDYKVTSTGAYRFRYYSNAFDTDVDSEFQVVKVNFDCQDSTGSNTGSGADGSAGGGIPAQLVWHDGTDEVKCKVTKPADPVRTGYTFGGWYTDAACTADNEFDFDNTQIKADTTLYAGWTVNTYDVSYQLTNPDGSAYTPDNEFQFRKYTYGQGLTLPVPDAGEDYLFHGWYGNAQYTGEVFTQIGETEAGDKTCYGYYEDRGKPVITAALSNGEAGDGRKWYSAADRPTITLTYSDNQGVSDIMVKVDDSEYTPVSGVTTGDPTRNETTADYELQEGVHTYTFKAVDTAGNETETDALVVKLDTTEPEFGDLTYDSKAKNILDWIIGKESLIITVPVTDNDISEKPGSGVSEVSYTLTPADGSTETTDTAGIEDGKAEITVSADFKGTVRISCSDAVGNAADNVTVGAAGGGIIVEDNAPAISALADRDPADTAQTGDTALSDSYYATAPAIKVTVSDVTDYAVTAGIASVACRIEGTDYPVTVPADALQEEITFTISADDILTGTTTITIEAADNAGNRSEKTVTLKVNGEERMPVAKIDYQTEKLTGLDPNADYTVNDTAYRTAADGCIDIDESWFHTTITIVKKGNGKETTDSAGQNLSVLARPTKPTPTGVDETGVHTMDGKLTGLTAGTAYDISKDGGKSWTGKTADADGEIKGVDAPAEYIVRVAATDSSFSGLASVPVKVDGYHIPVTFVANGKTCAESWAYYGKAPDEIPDVPEKADAGDKTYVGEWCADENGTPADLENITKEAFVYAFYTISYNITLQDGAGYTLAAQEGSASPVKEGGSFTFKFTINEGYEKTGSFAVRVNGAAVALEEDGAYTIGNIDQDQTVTVEGIAAVKHPSGPSDDNPGDNAGGDSNPPTDDNPPVGTTPGGTTPGGMTPGSTTPGGTAPGSTTPVGTTPGGTTPGGTTPGSTTPVGTTPGNTKPDGTTPGNTKPDGTTPGNTKPAGTTPGNTRPDGTTPGNTKPDGTTPGNTKPDGTIPGNTKPDGTTPDSTKPDRTTLGGKYPHKEAPDGKTPGGSSFPDSVEILDSTKLTAVIVPVMIEEGRLAIASATPGGTDDKADGGTDGTTGTGTEVAGTAGDGEDGTGGGNTADGSTGTADGSGADSAAAIPAGNVPGMTAGGILLQMEGGDGAVVVTVVCEEQTYTAGVADTVAVADAVLTQGQIQLVGGGETIEILIDVKDITDSIPLQDKEIIKDGIGAGRKEHQGLMLGMYIDISMFVKIGEGDWNAVTSTAEPIEVVIGIPEELKAEGREFTIIRSHNGAYALLPDTDDNPDTVTVSTDMFSAYAIAYEQSKVNVRCGLCHICPTFLGRCYFIWLAVIIALILLIYIIVRRKKSQEKE